MSDVGFLDNFQTIVTMKRLKVKDLNVEDFKLEPGERNQDTNRTQRDLQE